MRLLHTSDWHLGRTLHGVDLREYHEQFVDELVQLAAARQVDAIVIAGDVYDRDVPPLDSVRLLSSALARLAEVAPVVLTPGNHDSAVRLGFGANLFNDRVVIRADPADMATPVLIQGADGVTAAIYAIPYLDVARLRGQLMPGVEIERSHEAALRAAMDLIRADYAKRRAADDAQVAVVSAHAFVSGGQASESERNIQVGGVDRVPASVFEGVDYVALGHLHGPQKVGGDGGPVIRYSGSPLAFSFSEKDHVKSTAIVDLAPGKPAQVELVPIGIGRALVDIRGELAEIVTHTEHAQDWVRAIVTDPVKPDGWHSALHSAFPHLLTYLHEPGGEAPGGSARVVTAAHDPLHVADDFIEFVTGERASAADLVALRESLEAVRAAEASA